MVRFTIRDVAAVIACAATVILIAAAVAAFNWWRSPFSREGRLRQGLENIAKETEQRGCEIDDLTGVGKAMASDDKWTITVTGGLNAFFKQPSGDSRPGTDWAIVLHRGAIEKRIIVRTYSDEAHQGSEQQAHRALDFVAKLLRDGWNPDDFKPGELTVPDLSDQRH